MPQKPPPCGPCAQEEEAGDPRAEGNTRSSRAPGLEPRLRHRAPLLAVVGSVTWGFKASSHRLC